MLLYQYGKRAANIKARAVDYVQSGKDIDLMTSKMLLDMGGRYLDMLSAGARQTSHPIGLSTKALSL
jgi:hypothetical protein